MNKDNPKIGEHYKERLNIIESQNPIEAIQGAESFSDYYACFFKKICVLESAFYANATYIIKRDDWEHFSQMSKYELSQTDAFIEKRHILPIGIKK